MSAWPEEVERVARALREGKVEARIEEFKKGASTADDASQATGAPLAAEIAHQIKNPLGIIHNAAFALQRSVAAGKAVFVAEYEGEPAAFCARARALGVMAMLKRLELGPYRRTCR